MLLTAELAALNLDPAQQEGVVAAVLPLHAEAEKLRAQAKLDTLKIQALTLELAHLRRIRFGVKNEALSPEQRDLFRETADADSAAIEAEVEQQLPELRSQRQRAGRQPLPEHLPRIEHRHAAALPVRVAQGTDQPAVVRAAARARHEHMLLGEDAGVVAMQLAPPAYRIDYALPAGGKQAGKAK